MEPSRDQMRTVLETMAVAVTYCGVDQRFIWVSRHYASWLGTTPQEIAGKSIVEVIGNEAAEDIRPFIERLLSGQSVEYVKPLNMAGLGLRWVDAVCTPTKDDSGKVTGWISVVTDVTEARQLDRSMVQLASIVETSDDAIISKSLDGIIQTWNEGAERMFGYTAREAVGNPITILIPPERIHEEAQILARLRRGERISHYETVRIAKGGRLVEASETISPLRDRDGNIIGASKIVRDITSRKRAEEELAKAKHRAEEASRAKDHFLAVLSHELRTPLTPVITTVRLMSEDAELPARYQDDLELIQRNIELEARLIDDLLDVTRIMRGKLELEHKPVRVAEMVRRAVEICKGDLIARGLHLGVDVKCPDEMVSGDVARLQQIIWNLLQNSMKFTPRGGCVGISCGKDHDRVNIEVADSGRGIDSELMQRMFKPFEQGDGNTRQYGGLGLGLAIVQGLVQLHGGSISVYSEGRNRGARFRVRLPLATAPIQPHIESPDRTPHIKRKLRILVVEDHGDTVRVLKRLLMADGHEVQTAGDVTTAHEMAKHYPYDVLVSDLGLPDGSGLDLIRMLRQEGQHAPAVALSGFGQQDDLVRSREAGFNVHLTKPVDILRLRQVIGQLGQP